MENKLSSADVLKIAREKCLVPAIKGGSCRYWLPNGNRCAIGQCLPLEMAQELEACTSRASKIFDKIGPLFDETVTPEFLDKVQKCHDDAVLMIDCYDRDEASTLGHPKNLEWREEFLSRLSRL